MMTPLTPWQRHKATWKENGCGGETCQAATAICLARGKWPCDIVFIGQCPGNSENVHGYPFVGPAGHLLDKVIEAVQKDYPFTYAITNLTGCMPRSIKTGRKEHEPTASDVELCSTRLVDFVDNVAKPKGLVALGRVAQDHLDPRFKQIVQFSELRRVKCTIHPSFILRQEEHLRPFKTQELLVDIRNFVIDTMGYPTDEQYTFG
jgi:uracil-DNA glycosylase